MLVESLPSLAIAFVLAVGLLLALRAPALKVSLVDYPGGRKRHDQPTPVIGGIAVFGGFIMALVTLDIDLARQAPLLVGMALLLLCGMVDDYRDLHSLTKLAMQIVAAALIVVWAGLSLDFLGDMQPFGMLALGALAVPLTLFGIVGLVNAVNMLDGLDGLAGGAGFAMLFWLAVAAGLNGAAETQAVIAVLAASLFAFLLFNSRHPLRNRASVFLGDAGSMVLGLGIAWFCLVIAPAGPGAPVSPVAIAWIIALPVMDTMSLTVRRLLKGQSPFAPDREHLHHVFMRAGSSSGEASWVLVAIAFGTGAVGVSLSVFGTPDIVLLLGLLAAIALHFVFIRYAWRTVKALRRLRALAAHAPIEEDSAGRYVHALTSPIQGWRRGVALIGLYLFVAAIPLSTALTNVGLVVVLVATLLALPAFLRDMMRLPVFWLATVLTAYVGVVSMVGLAHYPELAAESEPHWRHVIRVTGLLSLPFAWWLAGASLHWPWLVWTLIAASAVAFAMDARWVSLFAGDLGTPEYYGAPDEYSAVAASVLVLLFTVCTAAIARLGRGWRPLFTLMISAGAAVPALVLLIASGYTTSWIGAGAGFVVVGVAAMVYGANRRQWAGLVGGVVMASLLATGMWMVMSESVPTRDAFVKPLQSGALYFRGEKALAGERHMDTVQRLSLWGEAMRSAAERPFTGWGVTSPQRALGADAIGGHSDSFMNYYLSLLVGYGVIGLAMFLAVVYLLLRRLRRATQRRLIPVSVATSLYGVTVTLGAMLLLSAQIHTTAGRSLVILVFGFLGAVAVMRLRERDRVRARRLAIASHGH